MVADKETGRTGKALNIERLTELSRAFTYATSLDAILTLAVTQAAEMLSASKAILLLPNEDGILNVSASHGVSPEVVSRFRESLDETLASRLTEFFGAKMAEGFVGVPLVSKGNVIGLLAVLRPGSDEASGDEEWLLSALADQVAAPLENARLVEALERAELLRENARLYESEKSARKAAEKAQERAEAALDLAEQSNRSKAAFLAAMSHDLRTPLNAIGGYVQILKMGLRGPVTEKQSADLDRIATNQQHLLSIVSDVLDFARIGAGRMTFRKSAIDLASNIIDVESVVMPQIKAKGITYRFDAPEAEIICETDPDKLRQILINLLSNAVKFTDAGGAITTSLQSGMNGDEPVVRIAVTDTGAGIPADRIDSIFLPFVQVKRTLTNPDEGIGLGLAISRDLARGLGGDITVASQYGQGSTFTLTLPLSPV
jgi:signal transduction histidine kinase